MEITICSSVDWAATGAMLSGLGTLIGAGAVIYAAHKGSDTFKQWRRQKNEERRIELAEQVLTLAYKLRRAIESIRSPGMWGVEQDAVYDELRKKGLINDETPLGYVGILATAQATLSRSDAYKVLWDELLDTMPSAKAIFGNEIEKALDEFWTQRHRVIQGALRYADIVKRPPARTEEGREKQLQRKFDIEAIIRSGGGEDGIDGIGNSIDSAVGAIEEKLLPIIRADTPFGTKAPVAQVD